MPRRIGFECLLALERPFDVGIGHLVFLGEAVGENRNSLSVKEVKNPLIDPSAPYSKLANSVPKVIGHRASKLVATLCQYADSSIALRISPYVTPTQVT